MGALRNHADTCGYHDNYRSKLSKPCTPSVITPKSSLHFWKHARQPMVYHRLLRYQNTHTHMHYITICGFCSLFSMVKSRLFIAVRILNTYCSLINHVQSCFFSGCLMMFDDVWRFDSTWIILNPFDHFDIFWSHVCISILRLFSCICTARLSPPLLRLPQVTTRPSARHAAKERSEAAMSTTS